MEQKLRNSREAPGPDVTSRTRMLAAALTLLSLCGCVSAGPDFEPPDSMLPAESFSSKPAPGQQARENVPPVNPAWWSSFRDPILTSLVQRAAAVNFDVSTATLRLAESRSQLGIAAAAQLPAINGGASYQRQLYSQNGIVSLARNALQPLEPNRPFIIPPISIYQPSFDASWELDIWGRVRRQVEAADAQAEAAEWQLRDTLISTLAEVARDYIQLRGVQIQIAITKQNIASALEILQLTKTLTDKGAGTELDIKNAAAEVESIESQLPSLVNQETAGINALNLLLDEPPGTLRGELAQARPVPPAPPHVPLGIPSELARRRPDIRAAEATLHAATANTGVAVANFYPSVKLNGSVGFNALDLKNLFKGSSLEYVFGPTLSIPIFDGGRLKSTLELTEVQQQEAAIAYHKTVLKAWHEVVDALAAYQAERQRRAHLKAQADNARDALALARQRYNTGVTSFISVLDAERTLLQAELQLAQSTAAVSTNLVQLYKALGGGWEQSLPDEREANMAVPQPLQ
jgi:NodT family efflux transporter outer membrane factor (OMF) lipoprotein